MNSKLTTTPPCFIELSTHGHRTMSGTIKTINDLLANNMASLTHVYIDTSKSFSFSMKDTTDITSIYRHLESIVSRPVEFSDSPLKVNSHYGTFKVSQFEDEFYPVNDINEIMSQIETLNNLVIGELDITMKFMLLIGNNHPDIVGEIRSIEIGNDDNDWYTMLRYHNRSEPIPDALLINTSYETNIGRWKCTDRTITDILDRHLMFDENSIPEIISREVTHTLVSGSKFIEIIQDIDLAINSRHADRVPNIWNSMSISFRSVKFK